MIIVFTAAGLLTACASVPDCSPNTGFEFGQAGRDLPGSCQQAEFAESYQLGRTLAEMRSEYQLLMNHLDELDANDRARLRVLERDIPELETLARIQGFMDPADLPMDPPDY